MKIKYWTSVKTPAGWRPVAIVAIAQPVSAKMLIVESVDTIDGETPGYRQSRTGAKRQDFNGLYFAGAQVGARKRLSTLDILEN